MGTLTANHVQRVAAAALLVAATAVPASAGATVRSYNIAADEISWDYAPTGINLMSGQPFNDDQLVFVGNSDDVGVPVIGRVYRKAVYQQYSDDWSTVIDGPSVRDPRAGTSTSHLGILGPVIRAEVGDVIVVHFKNNSTIPTSIHPHGVLYNAASEGAPYANAGAGNDEFNSAPGDDKVPPGGSYTYRWRVPERAGPGPNDLSSVAWPYHGHADETGDTNAGLIGMMVIYGRNQLSNDRARGVDREFFTLFNVFNENASSLFDMNAADIDVENHPDPDLFEESNLMHGMNGLVWGHNRGYEMRTGDKIRWYVMAMGTEVDLHTPHWHGVTLLQDGKRIDVTELLPAATKALELRADNAGTWMYHCHVNDHLEAGMMTKFTIE